MSLMKIVKIVAGGMAVAVAIGSASAAQADYSTQKHYDVAPIRKVIVHLHPRPVGLTPSPSVALTAQSMLGQTFGRGECTDFVDAVLERAKRQPGQNYVWGGSVSLSQVMPGDVIQFWDTHFTAPNGANWGTLPGGQHTAIVRYVHGTVITVIHQNFGTKTVTAGDVDLAWSHSGRFDIYRPKSL